MARPYKRGLDYFPHDTDASSDEKIEALRALFGNDGYAFYFIMLERIYRCPLFEIDVSTEQACKILAAKCGVSFERFKEIVRAAVEIGCYDEESFNSKAILTSQSIKRRAGVVMEKRAKMRERYEKKAEPVSSPDSAAKTTQETGEETPQRKEKESKEKQRKGEEEQERQAIELFLPWDADFKIDFLESASPPPKFGNFREVIRRLLRNNNFTLEELKRARDNFPKTKAAKQNQDWIYYLFDLDGRGGMGKFAEERIRAALAFAAPNTGPPKARAAPAASDYEIYKDDQGRTLCKLRNGASDCAKQP